MAMVTALAARKSLDSSLCAACGAPFGNWATSRGEAPGFAPPPRSGFALVEEIGSSDGETLNLVKGNGSTQILLPRRGDLSGRWIASHQAVRPRQGLSDLRRPGRRDSAAMKRTCISLVVLTVLVMMSSAVKAATILEFDPTGAAAGDRVTGRTKGAGMQGITSGRVTVLLAPSNRVADFATGPKDPRLVRFGVMTADEKDIGHFDGIVPDLSADLYIAVAFCRECAEGGSVFTIGEFEVTGAVLPRTGMPIALWLTIGASLLALGYGFRLGV